MILPVILIILLFLMFFAIFTVGELKIYQNGGDVYEWTKRLDVLLKKWNS